MNQKVLFFGLPGSGKSTQADLLKQTGFFRINAGDLIREAFKKGELIYNNYQEILNIITQINKAKETLPIKEMNKKIKGHKIIKEIKNNKIVLEL